MIIPKTKRIKDPKALKLYALDYPLCQLCGLMAVDVHHIIYKSQQGDDAPHNFISLCRSCHEEAHQCGEKEYLFEAKTNS